MSEQSEFLKELDIKDDSNLDKPIDSLATPAKEEEEESSEQKAKNRRERRLLEKNQQLREEAIALNARLQGISEAQKFTEEVGDPLKSVESIFGTDTPEKVAATNILKDALKGMSESAVQKALGEIDRRESEESVELAKEEETLDEIADRVEDDYGLDMSNDNVRRGYFSLMEKMSPKDTEGNVKEYADPEAVAETFKELQKRDTSRAKDLASRSMTRSGQSQPSKIEEDANWRALKEAGIF